jgi:ABC-2 type transport system permease protein
MKLLDITFKDLLQSSRSRTIFFFMFVVPIGVSLLFLLMFGGIGGDEGFQLSTIDVVIVNLDTGSLPDQFNPQTNCTFSDQTETDDLEDADSMGEVLVRLLQSDDFAEFMIVTEMNDEIGARAAVDAQDAGVAIILPSNFTESLIQSNSVADVTLYQDPTLTFSPLIVEAILRQILDTFNSAKIGVDVTIEQLLGSGITLDEALVQKVVSDSTVAICGLGSGGGGALVAIQPPPGVDEEQDVLAEIIGTILGGMMVFFAFYTGAASMETILTEEEKGTLARLFTTPTSHRTILGGKSLAGIITLTVQITVLLTFGALVLNISWGNLASVLIAALGIIIIAAATGVFLVSMLKNTRQGGIIFGGVLTLTGMLGLIPVFTAGVPNQPEQLNIVSLLVPQGWAMRGLTLAVDGASVQEMLPVFGVIMLWSLAFAFIGQRRMRKRFA